MEDKKSAFLRRAFDVAEVLVTALVIATALYAAGFRQAEVVGNSMQTTLQNGERLLLHNFLYEPKPGDIVVINRYDADKYYTSVDFALGRDEPLVKRVIAVGGDTVRVEKDAVFVNGTQLNEPYVHFQNEPYGMEVTVPEGFLFVMGDHRDDSLDSRFEEVGLIKTSDVMGKAVWKLAPFGRVE